MKKIHRIFQVGAFLVIVLGLLTPVSLPIRYTIPRIHPILMQLTNEAPDQMVSVIVQKVDESNRAESYAEKLGGLITKDLHIINAFSVDMTASSVRQLATSTAVRWVSLDAQVESTKGKPPKKDQDSSPLPQNYFLDTLGVRQVWNMGFRGEGIAVAVIDSGIHTDRDFTVDPGRPHTRIEVEISFSDNSFKTADATGHGTHVSGIIGGNGNASEGLYAGIAPKVDLINLKISDETGKANESDIVEALQWVLDNKDKYNVRVVNLSVNSTIEQSYHTSPMDAAVEILWFNGIVVVASVGNKGPGGGFNTVNAAPANDPFIITVGASDERGTSDPNDDVIAPYSAHGSTVDGFLKPEIIAPGKDIVSVLADTSSWKFEHPDKIVLDGEYIRLSGTSMSAPMVTGAVALLLQAEPNLTPDQVKYRLIHTSRLVSSVFYLDIYAAITGTSTESANSGIQASQLLWSGEEPVMWDSVNWNSVNWNSVNWNSVNWNSVNWNSVNWND